MSKETKTTLRFEQLNDWLSVPEVSRYLRIGRMTAYVMVNKGLLPHRRLGRRIIVPRSAVAPTSTAEAAAKVTT